MDSTTWKVSLYEVSPPEMTAKTGKSALLVDTFGVQAPNSDRALVEARAWLASRGRTVRSVNITTKPRELVAYVLPLPSMKGGRL